MARLPTDLRILTFFTAQIYFAGIVSCVGYTMCVVRHSNILNLLAQLLANQKSAEIVTSHDCMDSPLKLNPRQSRPLSPSLGEALFEVGAHIINIFISSCAG